MVDGAKGCPGIDVRVGHARAGDSGSSEAGAGGRGVDNGPGNGSTNLEEAGGGNGIDNGIQGSGGSKDDDTSGGGGGSDTGSGGSRLDGAGTDIIGCGGGRADDTGCGCSVAALNSVMAGLLEAVRVAVVCL